MKAPSRCPCAKCSRKIRRLIWSFHEEFRAALALCPVCSKARAPSARTARRIARRFIRETAKEHHVRGLGTFQ